MLVLPFPALLRVFSVSIRSASVPPILLCPILFCPILFWITAETDIPFLLLCDQTMRPQQVVSLALRHPGRLGQSVIHEPGFDSGTFVSDGRRNFRLELSDESFDQGRRGWKSRYSGEGRNGRLSRRKIF